MVSIEEAEDMLNDIAEEVPQAFYSGLNGGILLLPQAKTHPDHTAGDLFVLGEYHRDMALGRYIAIYYGSFCQVYGDSPRSVWREQLRKTLLHEFTHHVEASAGERGLEVKDEQALERLRRNGEAF